MAIQLIKIFQEIEMLYKVAVLFAVCYLKETIATNCGECYVKLPYPGVTCLQLKQKWFETIQCTAQPAKCKERLAGQYTGACWYWNEIVYKHNGTIKSTESCTVDCFRALGGKYNYSLTNWSLKGLCDLKYPLGSCNKDAWKSYVDCFHAISKGEFTKGFYDGIKHNHFKIYKCSGAAVTDQVYVVLFFNYFVFARVQLRTEF